MKTLLKECVVALVLGVGVMVAMSAQAADVALPKPVREGGKPLMQALNERQTGRTFANRAIEPKVLSSLLWAANGINRADGKRTAPTGMNVQDIDLYVMTKEGVFLYDAQAHALKPVGEPGDYRAFAGKQDFAQTAPLNLFFVQNAEKAMKGDELSNMRYAGIHTGAIMQNVYLFCAQEGLSTVARGYLDYEALAKVLKLSSSQHLILGQTVGYPEQE